MNSSVLWIFLIVAWLFILLPMVLRGRPEVRKTTQAAANTRLLHRGGQRAAVVHRSAGRHPSNPDYVRKPARTEPTLKRAVLEETPMDEAVNDKAVADEILAEEVVAEEILAEEIVAEEVIAGDGVAEETAAEVTDVLDAVEAPDDDILDVETVEEPADADAELDEADDLDDEYEDDADVGELDDEDLDDELDELDDVDDLDDELDDVEDDEVQARPAAKPRELRGRAYAPEAIAERDAHRYRERQRIVAGLTVATVLAIASCFFWQPYGFLATGVMVVLSGLYLYFLRRTALAEQQYRAQRNARLRRHAAEDERLRREQAEDVALRPAAPVRRRPGGMVVLEIDDEDPSFDHLPTYDFEYAEDAPVTDDYRYAV